MNLLRDLFTFVSFVVICSNYGRLNNLLFLHSFCCCAIVMKTVFSESIFFYCLEKSTYHSYKELYQGLLVCRLLRTGISECES